MEAADPAPADVLTAAGRFAPVAVYDRAMALTMREARWRALLAGDLTRSVGRAERDAAVAEVGAGTGSLALALRRALPRARITAIEPDPRARAIARAKAGGEGIDWSDGRAEALPLPDSSQDAVAMALLLHHLQPAAKPAALAEARRVLRPGGLLYVADFGQPQDPLMSAAFGLLQLIDGRRTTAEHRAGAVPRIVAAAGFAPPQRLLRLRTVVGTFDVLRTARVG